MAIWPATSSESIQERLTADHARLEASFGDVLRRIARDDRDETREAWNELERSLVAHLDAEEALLLPAFAVAHPDEAQTIAAEHEKIRARLLELGVAVDLHTLRLSDAIDFVHALRDHALHEDATLYRWADENVAAAVRNAVVRRLHPLA
jgi:hemerythrin-like domain-containing protein